MGNGYFRSELEQLHAGAGENAAPSGGLVHRIVASSLQILHEMRQGDLSQRDTLGAVCRMLATLDLYTSRFEPALVAESRQFFVDEGSRTISALSVPQFLLLVDRRLSETMDWTLRHLDGSSRRPLLQSVEQDLLAPHVPVLLEGLAAQAAIVVENSRLHVRLRERDRLAAMGEMAAGLAHEIRNPLGSIKAAAQFIDGVGGATAQQKEFLGIIVEEVGRLNRVVGSFLDYARPYQGNPSLGDPREVVARTLQLARADLPEDIHLEVELPESLPEVRIDPEHLRQVLLNLVRNASEAMQGDGRVVVSARARGGATLSEPGAVERPSTVEILVRDTGPGIAASVRQHLFVPFSTTKEKGTGLGLAISHRLVESAGGRLEMRSSDASGTTFAIVLPVATRASLVPPGDATASTDGLLAG